MKKLIFVYNADSDFVSLAKDIFVKYVTPSKYACNLCMITYGATGMKKRWKDFVDSLDMEVVFLHKDEFLNQYNLENPEFPAVYVLEKELMIIIKKDELNKVKNLNELIKLIEQKL